VQAAGTSSGSGIVIGTQGEILTNSHVVADCEKILVQFSSKDIETAIRVADDKKNDLAVLRIKTLHPSVATFRDGIAVRAGDTVVALGYPLSGLLATTANLSVGNVSALAGLGDDSRYVQISAPVQPGNSGGPLLDASGHLIGIVTAKLNAVRVARFTGDIPQNVNFALKAEVARTFLDSSGVAYRMDRSKQQLSPADIGDIARPFTVHIECQQKRSSAVAALPEGSSPSYKPPTPPQQSRIGAAVINFCKQLYSDNRLDPIRGIISFETAPTLSQQQISDFITNEQRPALDALKETNEKCRNRIAVANPRLWKLMMQIQPAPYANLILLYNKKITIGQYNTKRQEVVNKLQAALAGQAQN
jgi:hypothetical protein